MDTACLRYEELELRRHDRCLLHDSAGNRPSSAREHATLTANLATKHASGRRSCAAAGPVPENSDARTP